MTSGASSDACRLRRWCAARCDRLGHPRSTRTGDRPSSTGSTSLVEKSLLRQVASADGEPRFLMLGTIREYAIERLGRERTRPTSCGAATRSISRLSPQAAPELLGARTSGSGSTGSRRSARTCAPPSTGRSRRRRHGDGAAGSRAPLAVRADAGLPGGGRRSGCGVRWRCRGWRIIRSCAPMPSRRRGVSTGGAATSPMRRPDYRRCLELRRGLGDERRKRRPVQPVLRPGPVHGSPPATRERSAELIEEALASWRETSDKLGIGKGLWVKGNMPWSTGDWNRAKRVMDEGRCPLFRRARRPVPARLDAVRPGASRRSVTATAETAAQHLEEALRIFADAQDVSGYTLVLDAYAALAASVGDRDRAARVSGAVEQPGAASGTGLNPGTGSSSATTRHDRAIRDGPRLAGGRAAVARGGRRVCTGDARSDRRQPVDQTPWQERLRALASKPE